MKLYLNPAGQPRRRAFIVDADAGVRKIVLGVYRSHRGKRQPYDLHERIIARRLAIMAAVAIGALHITEEVTP